MSTPQVKDVPRSPDDRRLKGWYHTIDLGDGLVTEGVFDHRPFVDCYGLPDSLEGKTCLDVGTSNGFWAFEMERRGADRVVAIDIARWGDFDFLPWVREAMGDKADHSPERRFRLAHAWLGSRVEYQICNVYDLSPDLGTFDVVFCGSLIVHLRDPLRALVNLRSVTTERCIVATMGEPRIEKRDPDEPWLAFGERIPEETPGETCVYWRLTTPALRRMMEYAGFSEVEPLEPFQLRPPGGRVVAAVGRP